MRNQNKCGIKFSLSICDISFYQLPQQYTDKNNKIQTTSTKCQYQTANINPK